jgi:hypothetical protein
LRAAVVRVLFRAASAFARGYIKPLQPSPLVPLFDQLATANAGLVRPLFSLQLCPTKEGGRPVGMAHAVRHATPVHVACCTCRTARTL